MSLPLRVLLVEDSEGDAGLILQELRGSGYDPEFERVYAPDAFSAALAKQTWDIVIADYFMPGFDGLDALARIKESGLDLPFIIVSGVIGEEVAVAAMKSGAYDYVMKDNLARLGPAAQRALQEAEDRRARERAEAAQRQSERTARAILNTSSDSIVLLDPDGTILAANMIGAQRFGKEVDEIIGLCSYDLMEPDVAAIRKAHHDEVIRVGKPLRIEDEHHGIYFETTAYPIRDERGGVVRLAVFARDITGRKQTEEALRRHNRELALINQVGQMLSSTLDPDQVLAVAMEEVCSILGVVAASIWLVDPETGELVCRQAIGPKAAEVRGWRLSPGEGIVGLAAEQGQSLIVPDAQADEHHYREVDRRTGLDLRSIVSVPLRIGQNVIGVLQVVDTEVNRFSEGELTLLEPLAASAAIAFENARLYEHAQQEIAERKRAEEALRESEHRYRALFDSASDAIFIHDLEGRFLEVNQVACERLGYSREELLQMTPMAIDSPEYAALVPERIEELRQRGHVLYEAAHVRRDGTTIPVELSSRVIEYAGEPAILSIARDITERKQAEAEREQLLAALARRSAQLQAAAEVSRAASSILDPDELIQRVVDLARERFGLYYAGLFLVDKSGKWIDEPGKWAVLWAATGEEGRQLVEQGHKLEIGGLSMIGWCVANKQARIALDVGDEAVHFSTPLLPDTRSEVALPLISRGEAIGALTIQSSKPEAFSDEDVVALQTMADQLANAIENAWLYDQAQRELAERERVEEMLRQYAAELEMRNEELDAFARTVAHDLKTPLGLLTGYTEILAQEHATMPGEELPEYLQTMAGTAFRMNNIIDELLLLSELREREVETVPLDMDRIVADAQQRLTGMIREHQAEIVLPEAWPTALGYGPWVEAVWANYISNAIKYGGQPPRVELGATPQRDGMVRFWVRDNGPGLTIEEQALLFVPFTRLDQVRVKGHGLGLSIVRRIVEKLGGKVGVESKGGQGSVFAFTLPGDNHE